MQTWTVLLFDSSVCSQDLMVSSVIKISRILENMTGTSVLIIYMETQCQLELDLGFKLPSRLHPSALSSLSELMETLDSSSVPEVGSN